jgi:hypothetical protein
VWCRKLKNGGYSVPCWINDKRGGVMSEDDNEIGLYERLLGRIIIPFAVIIAVPVVLVTVTAFLRNQVPLPKVSTFHSLLATASTNAPGRAIVADPRQQQLAPRQAKLAETEEARATEGAASKGPLLGEHPPDANASAPSAAQMADASGALAALSNSATPMPVEGAHGLPPPLAPNDGAPTGTTGVVAPMHPAPATEAKVDALSASAPLSGPIRLPRPRPHDAGTSLSNVPMPRPRPPAIGSGAQQETTTNKQLGLHPESPSRGSDAEANRQ